MLPTVPSYDPFSWIIWGREVSDPHLAFAIGGGPSWKPLPFAFTVVYGLFGSAAPTLWVITARVGGLLGLVAAWRLSSRLAGDGRWGAVAGLLAVGGILTTQDWGYYFMRGASEPGLVACTLWAIDRLWDGRRGSAFWLAVAASLIRPEWWPFLLVYAGWLWLRDPTFRGWRTRTMLLTGLALVAVLWFGPPWIGSGHPLLAATHAAEYDGHLGADPTRAIIGRGADIQAWPLLAAAIATVVVMTVRGRGKVWAALGAVVVAWWAVVVGMTLVGGFPGLERFFLPAAAVVCVLGAAGFVGCARWVGRAVVRSGAIAAAGTLVVLVAASVAASWAAIEAFGDSEAQAALAARTLAGMDNAVRAAGGRAQVLPCPRSFAAVNHAAQPALAWELRATLERVGPAMTAPGVDFIGPANIATGVPAAIDPRLIDAEPLAHVGRWRVMRLTDPRDPRDSDCAGR